MDASFGGRGGKPVRVTARGLFQNEINEIAKGLYARLRPVELREGRLRQRKKLYQLEILKTFGNFLNFVFGKLGHPREIGFAEFPFPRVGVP